ncbi:hypothetical protein EDD18DRAFT_1336336 [Armillaria luteobubalina]|uniref:Uncharacterized protein n=1 Tax=Armillaria luteobubalina TaxID=153913 RepID=A0AA39UIJ1_9AGAR|nr:hypothetical protein EDD18DRAFT_1336336 [Armillaria luteobubalina]
MFHAIPWRSMFLEILTSYSTKILPPLSESSDLPGFQNALQELIGEFFSPGYIVKVSFEERCAWIGSVTTMDETALLSVSKELQIPYIQATGDELMEHDKHEASMTRRFGDNLDYRQIPGGGHASFYEFPGTMNSMIVEFVLLVYDTGVDTGL